MTLLEALRRYLRNCPYFPTPLGVDYLGSETGAFALEAVPAKEVVKQYTDGGALKQFLFLLSGRRLYSPDAQINLENTAVYEGLCRWLAAEERAGSLPELGEGRQAVKITPLTGGYVYQGGPGAARYQMQLQLTYYEGGR